MKIVAILKKYLVIINCNLPDRKSELRLLQVCRIVFIALRILDYCYQQYDFLPETLYLLSNNLHILKYFHYEFIENITLDY